MAINRPSFQGEQLVKKILVDEFSFTPLYDDDFLALPSYLRETQIMIERKCMDYKIATEHFYRTAWDTKEWVQQAVKVIEHKRPGINLGIEFGDVQVFFHRVLTLRADVQDLIDIYNAGVE